MLALISKKLLSCCLSTLPPYVPQASEHRCAKDRGPGHQRIGTARGGSTTCALRPGWEPIWDPVYWGMGGGSSQQITAFQCCGVFLPHPHPHSDFPTVLASLLT